MGQSRGIPDGIMVGQVNQHDGTFPRVSPTRSVLGLESHIPPYEHGTSDRALQSASLQSFPKGGVKRVRV